MKIFPASSGLVAPHKMSRSLRTDTQQSEALPTEHVSLSAAPVPPKPGEGILEYLARTQGQVSPEQFRRWVGMAGPYKEGDEAIGVAATLESDREQARQLLSNTKLSQFVKTPLWDDSVHRSILDSLDPVAYDKVKGWTVGQLSRFVLDSSESQIKSVMAGLPSDAIAAAVKLMSNQDLVSVGQKVFNPLPVSNIGAKGYLGARVQPNSPTDSPEDVMWQVFDAWAYGVGDVMLGTNPVSGTVEGVGAVEECLKDIVKTFAVEQDLPWVVLSHIDVQNQVEIAHPGSTALFFQSIAGTESANQVFDVSVPKMTEYAKQRQGRFGLYLETGQGADFTNGQAHGVDMGTLEARKYGLARALKKDLGANSWMLVNDVAGFIGPEVFRTKDQLVRVALEDTVMGKLHGLTIGLDICATLHMPISLAELDQAQDEILKANPAYLMALPTKMDPMLSYATTGVLDHLRLRDKFGYKIAEPMAKLFEDLGILDKDGKPGEHFGDPSWLYAKFQQAKGDQRPLQTILAEGQQRARVVQERGVPLISGRGAQPWDMQPELAQQLEHQVSEAKKNIWTTLSPEFLNQFPTALHLHTQSQDRQDFICHPPSGESLSAESKNLLASYPAQQYDVRIVISDGLNAKSISDPGHLQPFLLALRQQLQEGGHQVDPREIFLENGRVRAGYRIGEESFAAGPPGEDSGESKAPKTIVHVIGERPGTIHDNYSVYVSTAPSSVWQQPGKMDHDQTKVVSGISDSSLDPQIAAQQVSQLIGPSSDSKTVGTGDGPR